MSDVDESAREAQDFLETVAESLARLRRIELPGEVTDASPAGLARKVDDILACLRRLKESMPPVGESPEDTFSLPEMFDNIEQRLRPLANVTGGPGVKVDAGPGGIVVALEPAALEDDLDERVFCGKAIYPTRTTGQSAMNFGAYTVAVNPCRNLAGDDTDAAVTLTVRVPHAAGSDPNIRVGDVIAFVEVAGEYLCVSDVTDAKRGTIRILPYASTVPAGWALCDGTGGTLDLRDRFVAGSGGEWGLGGGYKTHGPDENGHYDHPDHNHQMGVYEYLLQGGSFNGLNPSAPGVTFCYTGIQKDLEGGAVTFDHAETDNRPPFVTVQMIQRID